MITIMFVVAENSNFDKNRKLFQNLRLAIKKFEASLKFFLAVVAFFLFIIGNFQEHN